MILEAEVEGALDETWQDSKRACVEDVRGIADVLKSLKVRDICCIDVTGKTSSFDYFVNGTCEGGRHIHLAAWAVQEADQRKVAKIPRRQTDHAWEVVTVGRIVVNLMTEAYRDEVAIERKWAVTKSMDPLDAAQGAVSEGRKIKAHGLWTLTLNLQDLEDFEIDYCKDVLLRQL
jgi:ribosomal silencing factor RsfS